MNRLHVNPAWLLSNKHELVLLVSAIVVNCRRVTLTIIPGWVGWVYQWLNDLTVRGLAYLALSIYLRLFPDNPILRKREET